MRKKAAVAGRAAVLAVALIAPSGASAGTLLTSHLTGKQIVNPSGGDPDGSATVILKVNRQKARICWTLNYKKPDAGSRAHVPAQGRRRARSPARS